MSALVIEELVYASGAALLFDIERCDDVVGGWLFLSMEVAYGR